MKKKFTMFILLTLLSANSIKAQILIDILKAIATEIGKSSNSSKQTVKNLGSYKVIVNSASKARFGNGKTRETIKVNLPAGTTTWYYRVTVLDIGSTYNYQDNETFHYILTNNKFMDTYKPTTEGIDFYILGHSGDVATFEETGNNNFRSFPDYTKTGTNSFVGKCNLLQDNLWIGIKNPNAMKGLQVIVEIEAWGNYN